MIWVFNDDCREVMKNIPDESVDAIITDPPYGVSVEGNNIHRTHTEDIKMDFGKWDRFDTDDTYQTFTYEWGVEAMRTLKKDGWVFVFSDFLKLDIITYLMKKLSLKQRSLFSWCKSNPPPSYRKYNLVSSVEYVWVGSKGKCRIPNFLSQKEMKNYMITPNKVSYGETEHPTEKPLELARRIVKIFSKENETVLDPFMGSGTFGVACLLENRKYIGIEKNNSYYEMAEKRIKKYKTEKQDQESQGDFLQI